MKTYHFKFSVNADSEKSAAEIMRAIGILCKKLKPAELVRMGEIAEKEPAKLQLAKTYLGV